MELKAADKAKGRPAPRSRMRLVETPYCSLLQGPMPDGCRGCVKGEKLVLFVTGLCPATCFFCPLSEEKKMKDVIWANEQQLEGDEAQQIRMLIQEAKENKATGAGVTGGDPLTRLDRTCAYIRALKSEFGRKFHIHLYTPLILVNETTMKALYDAGLDEIRFHPSLTNDRFWERMKLGRRYGWKVGIEIPVLPDRVAESKRLIEYAGRNKLIDFLNLNELEISERTIETFEERGYRIVRSDSYAIKGSKEAARELLAEARKHNIPSHFCTVHLKDRIQMGNRIIRRAENVAQGFDIVDDEGLLTRGAIYLNYSPKFSYGKKLKSLAADEKEKEILLLQDIFHWLQAQGMPKDAGLIDARRLRIVMSAEALSEIAAALKNEFPKATCAVITEYPTSDAFIVEMDEL
jgi:pyruvate formate-lyase activating enzyme-like uncharacterized protein